MENVFLSCLLFSVNTCARDPYDRKNCVIVPLNSIILKRTVFETSWCVDIVLADCLNQSSNKVNGWLIEEWGFDSGQGREKFLFSTASRLPLQPTQHTV